MGGGGVEGLGEFRAEEGGGGGCGGRLEWLVWWKRGKEDDLTFAEWRFRGWGGGGHSNGWENNPNPNKTPQTTPQGPRRRSPLPTRLPAVLRSGGGDVSLSSSSDPDTLP